MTRVKVQSLDQAVRVLAVKKLAAAKPEALLAQLKKHGIGNLEELARQVVANASRAVQSGVAASWEDDIPMICYKFSSYRPLVDPKELQQEVAELNTLVKEGTANLGTTD
jgi:predicted ATPase